MLRARVETIYLQSKMGNTLVDVNKIIAILYSQQPGSTILVPNGGYHEHENHISLLNKIQDISRDKTISIIIQEN